MVKSDIDLTDWDYWLLYTEKSSDHQEDHEEERSLFMSKGTSITHHSIPD